MKETLARVQAHWASSVALTEQTQLRMGETVSRFAQRLAFRGTSSFAAVTPRQAEEFVRAATGSGRAPQLATMHARRTALRALYRSLRALGLANGDPTLDLQLPPRGELAARPLTDDELGLARLSAYGHPQLWSPVRATVWALAEATAVSSEIAAVRVADVRHGVGATGVALPGTRRHEPRVGVLSEWGRAVVARRVVELHAAGADGQTLLAYGGRRPPGGAKAQAAACTALRAVLNQAGLGREPDVRPGSVRHWAGRVIYERTGSIEQAALALGHRSLDEAATDIGLDWRAAATGRGRRSRGGEGR
ncbi:hypothetical protein M6B22_13420 [Jatrophihabitans cynanchi]|uniref:Integrase n=1 Tax=Jatrophihabitans cynanchi TaxID=2944128 RepID=A0ABY7JSJ7_9ACTN|nr:hypothetical protein [Jatrophihabitans sp. SB3-54]WAX55540.1 hypothetical protein M6B22_13420 [Jatrophihabitans sp. SB3-54]